VAHPEDRQIRDAMDRTHQVWEIDDDGLIHFVVGAPEVTIYTSDGAPFQFSHPCFSVDEDGCLVDWPLVETTDRPLEVKHYTRLA
jgi:hypothetical protein